MFTIKVNSDKYSKYTVNYNFAKHERDSVILYRVGTCCIYKKNKWIQDKDKNGMLAKKAEMKRQK